MTEQPNVAGRDGTKRRIEHIRKTVAAGGHPHEVCLTRFAGQLLLREVDRLTQEAAINDGTILGLDDEPQRSGAIVAVYYGDYREQEIWVRSGANIGNWYPLGGEWGRPARGSIDGIPQHPHWEDVLVRGPVTLLSAGAKDTYAAGWTNGRRRMIEQIEALSDDA